MRGAGYGLQFVDEKLDHRTEGAFLQPQNCVRPRPYPQVDRQRFHRPLLGVVLQDGATRDCQKAPCCQQMSLQIQQGRGDPFPWINSPWRGTLPRQVRAPPGRTNTQGSSTNCAKVTLRRRAQGLCAPATTSARPGERCRDRCPRRRWPPAHAPTKCSTRRSRNSRNSSVVVSATTAWIKICG